MACAMPSSWALQNKYPDPNRQTLWNKLTDSLHTMGQSPRQAALTKSRLHNTRLRKRSSDIQKARRKAWLNTNTQQE